MRLVLLLCFSLCLAGCKDDDVYCYKGHDETYTVTGYLHTMRVCDEWRSSKGQYPQQERLEGSS